MRCIFVLPTYNERENLGLILPKLLKLPDCTGIVIVDDDSPDGTGLVARRWERHHKEVRLVTRKETRGLASAYFAGFKAALENNPEAIVTIDCDLSHCPDDVQRMLKQLGNCEIVIGSRYIRGSTIINWPATRLAVSTAANYFARSWLSLGIRDCTSGFRAYQPSLIKCLLGIPVKSKGYSIQVELLYESIHLYSARTVEVPITFQGRERGNSKLSPAEIFGGFKALLQLGAAKSDL